MQVFGRLSYQHISHLCNRCIGHLTDVLAEGLWYVFP
jgi:hypothetical protein